MRISLLSIISAAAFFAGCATTQINYRPEVSLISEPPIGAVVTANVGDEMVRQGRFVENAAIQLDSPIKIGVLGYYTLTPGLYDKIGEDGEWEFYRPAPGQGGGSVERGALVDPWDSIRLAKGRDRIEVVTVMHATAGSEAKGIKRTKRLAASENSFQQTLIYNGRVGSKINVGYREFSSNQARPAFNNEVEYDLAESKTIAYKGAEIEVLDANNRMIKYRVIRNFNQAVR